MKKAFLLSTLASAILATTAQAQQSDTEEVERITVLGDLRQHELFDVPYTVSVVDAKTIDDRSAQHVEDVLNTIPNVNFSSGASRARYFQVRGIGERSQFVDPINPSVGVLIDGIDYSGIGAAADLFDVEQVEVFRGPQGTRFGANALAGLVNINTTAAGSEQNLLRFGLSNYGGRKAAIATGGMFNDDVGYRLSVNKQQSDGYIDNVHLNRNDTNNIDELSVKAKLSVALDDEQQLNWAFHYFDSDNGYDAFSLDNNRTTLSDKPGTDAQQTYAGAMTYTYSGLAAADLQITASFANTDVHYGYDEDWAYEGIAPGWEYASTDNYFRDREQLSFDARLLSKQAIFNDTTDWVVGVYYLDKDESLKRDYTYAAAFNSDYTPTNTALYGELRSQLNDRLSVSLGARVEQFDADYSDSNQVVRNADETLWGANLSLEYSLEDSLIYATVSRGYKPGGVNGEALGKIATGDFPDSVKQLLNNNSTFEEESLINYELGLRGNALDGDLFYSVQAFYMDRKDVQVKFFYSDQPSADNDLTQPVFIGYLVNADIGSNKGVELELDYQLNDVFNVEANVGWLSTSRSGLNSIDAARDEKRDQAHAPGFQYHLAAEYQFAEKWTARIEFEGKDAFYFSESHDTQSDDVSLVNASLIKTMGDWKMTLWARNLTDEDYPVRGFFFGNDPRDEYTAKPYTQLGEPRLVGISFDYSF